VVINTSQNKLLVLTKGDLFYLICTEKYFAEIAQDSDYDINNNGLKFVVNFLTAGQSEV